MFNLLKKLLMKEEFLPSEAVEVGKLDSWLERKIFGLKFNQEIIDFFAQIVHNQQQLEQQLAVLETAEIEMKDAEKVEQKIQNIVIGHRDNYCRQMRLFGERLAVPERQLLPETITFIDNLNQGLDALARKTTKSYQAAQHLFFSPVEKVFKTVGEINRLVKEFDQRIEQSGLKKIIILQDKISLLLELQEKQAKLGSEQHGKQQKIERCRIGHDEQEKIIASLQGSEEYQQLTAVEEEIRSLNVLLEQNNSLVFAFFSKLSRGLRKFSRLYPEDRVLASYLADAVKAFHGDSELKVIDVLQQLGLSINRRELELDDKESGSVLEMAEKAKSGHLRSLQECNFRLQSELEEKKSLHRRFNVDKFLAEAKYKQEHFSGQLSSVQAELEEMKLRSEHCLAGEEKLRAEIVFFTEQAFHQQLTLINTGMKPIKIKYTELKPNNSLTN